MAEKLSVQIALEGGALIEQQLAGIGETGTKAFGEIVKAAEEVGGFKNLDPTDVTAKLQEMGVTGADAIGKIQSAVQQARGLETLVQGITSVETALSALAQAAPIVGAALVAAFTAAYKAANIFADSVNKVSDEAAQLGVSIQVLDQFRAGLEQAGISAQGVSSILQQVKSDADKLSLDRIKQDARELQQALASGFGAENAFKRLQEAANQFTPAGKAAREELLKMGQAIPGIGEGLQRIGDPVPGLVVTMQDVRELGVELAKLKGVGIDIKINDDAITQTQKIIEGLAKMPDAAQAAQIAMQRFGPAGAELVAALRTGALGIDQFKARLGTMSAEQEAAANKMRQSSAQMSADWERFKVNIGAPIAMAGLAATVAVFEAIKGGIATTVKEFVALGAAINAVATVGAGVIAALVAPIQLVIDAVSALISSLSGLNWDSISGAGVTAWNAIVSAIQKAVAAVIEFAAKTLTIGWEWVKSIGVAAWDAVTDAIQFAIKKLLEYIGLKPTAPPAVVGAAGHASGGLLGGRGTGTSDSNLAWVSRGEYITPARAVRQPGVLSFLEGLRRSGGDLRRVLDGMGRFALGGMVPRALPAFAAGGLAGGMSNVTIQFPGLPPISGLRASSGVVDELHKAAALAQVRSGGRKPSRYS